MNATYLIVWVLTVLGLLGPSFVPALLLRHSKKLSLQELTEVHPELAWMRSVEWIFLLVPLTLIAFYILFGVFAAVLLIGWLGQPESYFFGALGVGAAILNGFFAMIAGVCPVPSLSRMYLFVYGDLARRVGLLQILSAFAVIIVYACWP